MAHNKEKKRLNALDILLLIVLIGAIAVVVASIVRANPGIVSGGDKEIEYVIKAEAVYSELLDNVAKGDKLYDTESGQLLGEVIDVTSKPAVNISYNNFGNPVETTIEGKSDLFIKIKVAVWEENGALHIDGYRIAVGRSISCQSSKIVLGCVCVSIAAATASEA